MPWLGKRMRSTQYKYNEKLADPVKYRTKLNDSKE